MTMSLLSWHKILSIAIHVHLWAIPTPSPGCSFPYRFYRKSSWSSAGTSFSSPGVMTPDGFPHQGFLSPCTGGHVTPSFRELLATPCFASSRQALLLLATLQVAPSGELKKELRLFAFCIHSVSCHELPLQTKSLSFIYSTLIRTKQSLMDALWAVPCIPQVPCSGLVLQ